jgi:Tol biopolymer transport system component
LNSGLHGEVYTIGADGQHLKNITDNHRDSGSADPVWSPDGTKILFLSAHSFEGGFGIGPATMNPDGTGRHLISSGPQEMY